MRRPQRRPSPIYAAVASRPASTISRAERVGFATVGPARAPSLTTSRKSQWRRRIGGLERSPAAMSTAGQRPSPRRQMCGSFCTSAGASASRRDFAAAATTLTACRNGVDDRSCLIFNAAKESWVQAPNPIFGCGCWRTRRIAIPSAQRSSPQRGKHETVHDCLGGHRRASVQGSACAQDMREFDQVMSQR